MTLALPCLLACLVAIQGLADGEPDPSGSALKRAVDSPNFIPVKRDDPERVLDLNRRQWWWFNRRTTPQPRPPSGGGSSPFICQCVQSRAGRQAPLSAAAELASALKKAARSLERRQQQNDSDDLISGRIVGGTDTRRNEYPETVLVALNNRQHCAGTILNSRYILTAAHCIYGHSNGTAFSVWVNVYNLSDLTGAVEVKVARGIYHPDYNSATYDDNDIALLELDGYLNTGFQPACIPLNQRNYVDDLATSVGWGRTSENGSMANVLQKVDLPVLSNTRCNSMYNVTSNITSNMMCAGYAEGGKDACGGDSGGPLFVSQNQQRWQVGVTSFGVGCARANRPGVYARIDQETSFLRNNMPNVRSCGIYSPDA